MNEISILENIDHPNIVKMVEAYDNANAYYIVMELMEGGELFDRIIEQDFYSESKAAKTLRTVVDAIKYYTI